MKKLLYAMPTMHCNLHCNHCELKDRPEVFNREEFLSKLNSFDGDILLFGGEVTSNLSRMFDIINSNKDNGISKINRIATNLIILNDDLVKLYKEFGGISTSWNPSRFNENEYETWRNNCKTISDNEIHYLIMITLADDLLNIPVKEFIKMVSGWEDKFLKGIKLENYVGDVTPEHFAKVDEWLCELYQAWNIPIKLELLDRMECWKYDCDHVYSLTPDGTLLHSCPHNFTRHVPIECYSCELVGTCRPCKLQKYCSFPKKLKKLIDSKGDL